MDLNFDITTPALLFPAVSLLMLAYTNRFLALANIIRQLHAEYRTNADPGYLAQIESLRHRVHLIRNMQFAGGFSLLLCTVSMFLLFYGRVILSEATFSLALLAMITSLYLSLREINISVHALDLHLQDIEHTCRK